MSEMSFKQAKEIVERLEFTELTLKKTLANIHKSSKTLDRSLEKQNQIMDNFPQSDKRINNLKLLVVLNVGFILGLLVSKLFF
ncbi:MAG: hypothetical protein HRT42_00220 [Campylobacteraceae bacterium]|nr:hypothetical protein [Campylobacteraceae bacterium]